MPYHKDAAASPTDDPKLAVHDWTSTLQSEFRPGLVDHPSHVVGRLSESTLGGILGELSAQGCRCRGRLPPTSTNTLAGTLRCTLGLAASQWGPNAHLASRLTMMPAALVDLGPPTPWSKAK